MKNRFSSSRSWFHLVAYICSPFLFAVHAIAADYHECVGRYEITLPGPVDVATTTPLIFEGKDVHYPIQFPDGQQTKYSSFLSNGEFAIIQSVSDSWARGFLNERRTFVAASKTEPNEDKRFSEVSTGQPDFFAMSGSLVSEFDIYKNGQLVSYTVTSYDDSPEATKKRMMDTLANLRMRKPNEIPREKGVCLPGIFVADPKEDHGRTIGVTFRLKENPDVTIFFLDSSASDLSKKTSQQKSEFIWSWKAIGRVIHLHGPLRFRPTMMAGRLGTASFATVTRYDGATDYAYLVTVQGDEKASVDTPDLELLVQRTEKNAKGVPPVSGNQLEDIAKAIAASVKRTPVQ